MEHGQGYMRAARFICVGCGVFLDLRFHNNSRISGDAAAYDGEKSGAGRRTRRADLTRGAQNVSASPAWLNPFLLLLPPLLLPLFFLFPKGCPSWLHPRRSSQSPHPTSA